MWGEKTLFFGKHQGVDVPNTSPQLPISASGCHAHWTLIFRRPQKAPRGYREDVSGTGIYNFQVAHRKAYKRHYNSHVGKVCI